MNCQIIRVILDKIEQISDPIERSNLKSQFRRVFYQLFYDTVLIYRFRMLELGEPYIDDLDPKARVTLRTFLAKLYDDESQIPECERNLCNFVQTLMKAQLNSEKAKTE